MDVNAIVRRANAAPARRKSNGVKGFSMPPFWSYDGARVALSTASYSPDRESGGDGFEDYVQSLMKTNGIVFALMAARIRVFSQARFQMQQARKGRWEELFDDQQLRTLEQPWPNGTTGELLTHMEVDASLAGNFFATWVSESGAIARGGSPGEGDMVVRMRPDWCQLVIKAPSGNPFNVDARVVGLAFRPPGTMAEDALLLTRKQYVHYSPLPDPVARFRGMSWVTPILRDIMADNAYTTHKLAFLKNGATPNLAVKVDPDTEPDDFLAFVQQFRAEYEGADNAYRTLFLAGGADVTPLSIDFAQLDLKKTQGAGETRMAAAGGVPPSIAGLSEGLEGSALNAGNFTAARRLFVDSTMRDLWGKAAPSLSPLAPPPRAGTRLWYDDRDIPFLREDAKDESETFFKQIQSVDVAIRSGFKPDAAVKAAKARDIGLLSGQHTGLISVQLHDPTDKPPDPAAPKPPGANGAAPQLRDMPALAPAGTNRSNGNAH